MQLGLGLGGQLLLGQFSNDFMSFSTPGQCGCGDKGYCDQAEDY